MASIPPLLKSRSNNAKKRVTEYRRVAKAKKEQPLFIGGQLCYLKWPMSNRAVLTINCGHWYLSRSGLPLVLGQNAKR